MRFVIVCIFIVVIIGFMCFPSESSRCSRIPEGYGATKTPADGRFHIRILENTNKYVPGKTYTSK